MPLPPWPPQFEKIIGAFCNKKSVDPNQVRFVFDGVRVERTACPDDLEMTDGGERVGPEVVVFLCVCVCVVVCV